MSLADDAVLLQARLAAALPALSTGNTSHSYLYGTAILSAINDIGFTLAASAANISITSASGSGLDALAANYGVQRNQGTPATALVVFSVPVAATVAVNIPAGTVVSTQGDGITTQAVSYITLANAVINIGNTSAAAVLAQATVAGIIGNAAVTTIIVMVTQVGGGVTVSNTQAVDGTNGTILGVDPQTDGQLRNSILGATALNPGALGIQAAINAVSTVFDSYVNDPQDGSGNITYYWTRADGTAPTYTGGSVVGGAITGATLTSTALAVDTAVRAILPPGITPKIGGAGSATSPFTITSITTASVTYSAPAGAQSGTIQPLMTTAIQAYIQSLTHNQVPTLFGMAQFVANALSASPGAASLTNFTLTLLNGSAPGTFSASNTTVYRAASAPTVTYTRV